MAVEEAILLDMLYSLLPAPSSFELPSGTFNGLLSIDEMKTKRRTNFMWKVFFAAFIFLALVTCFRRLVYTFLLGGAHRSPLDR